MLAGCSGLGQQSSSVPSATTQSVARGNSVQFAIPRNLIGVHTPESLLIGSAPNLYNPKLTEDVIATMFSSTTEPMYELPNTKNVAPECTLAGFNAPNGVGAEVSGELGDPDGGSRSYIQYSAETKTGCGTPEGTAVAIPNGAQPTDVAFDNASKIGYVDTLSQNVYPIAEDGTAFKTPLTCSLYASSFADAADNAHNVFVAGRTSAGSAVIVKYAGGAGACAALGISGFSSPGGITLDSHKNLIDVDFDGNIHIWAPPYTGAPSTTVALHGTSVYAKLDKLDHNLYVGDYANGAVDVYTYVLGTHTPTYHYSFNSGITQANVLEGIVVIPPQT
jgi:hypothetical protein